MNGQSPSLTSRYQCSSLSGKATPARFATGTAPPGFPGGAVSSRNPHGLQDRYHLGKGGRILNQAPGGLAVGANLLGRDEQSLSACRFIHCGRESTLSPTWLREGNLDGRRSGRCEIFRFRAVIALESQDFSKISRQPRQLREVHGWWRIFNRGKRCSARSRNHYQDRAMLFVPNARLLGSPFLSSAARSALSGQSIPELYRN